MAPSERRHNYAEFARRPRPPMLKRVISRMVKSASCVLNETRR
jgi:hypothetical protein